MARNKPEPSAVSNIVAATTNVWVFPNAGAMAGAAFASALFVPELNS